MQFSRNLHNAMRPFVCSVPLPCAAALMLSHPPGCSCSDKHGKGQDAFTCGCLPSDPLTPPMRIGGQSASLCFQNLQNFSLSCFRHWCILQNASILLEAASQNGTAPGSQDPVQCGDTCRLNGLRTFLSDATRNGMSHLSIKKVSGKT